MSYLNLPEDLVRKVRPSEVRHYAIADGWLRVEGVNGTIALYRHPESDLDQLIVPLDPAMDGYGQGMADVIARLAKRSGLLPNQVLDNLLNSPSDVLRLRVSASDATVGNLPLEEGLRLLRGGRDMLLSAACSTIRPKAFHPEMSLRKPNDFIRNCRLGQTERGSFVATIITPVPPSLRQTALPGDEAFEEAMEPFARRVTTRLMGSLEIVDDAVRTARLDPILGGVEDGVSANLCDAMVAMRPEGDQSRLDISMSWSRSRDRIPDRVPKVVTFAREDFLIIEEAGQRLRERATPRRERFVGTVHILQSEIPSLFDDPVGKIIIRTMVGGQPARVKVVLHRDDYKRACDAHRDERRVAVTGIIHHDIKVRVYELSEAQDFQILDGE